MAEPRSLMPPNAALAESVEHLHHAMTWDFRLVVVANLLVLAFLAWLIVERTK